MKRTTLFFVFAFISVIAIAQPSYEFKNVTTVESVASGGLGRSRMISTDKDKQVTEKDLESFYSLVGLNFKNIANNDKIIVDKISEMAKDGWELYQTATGVHSSVNDNSGGVFITRYFFRRLTK